jgi:hypothetical protein
MHYPVAVSSSWQLKEYQRCQNYKVHLIGLGLRICDSTCIDYGKEWCVTICRVSLARYFRNFVTTKAVSKQLLKRPNGAS